MNVDNKHRANAIVDHMNYIDPPIDFSFLGLNSPYDALDEVPRIRNVSMKKGQTRKFKSNTLLMNNNTLTECTGIQKLLSHFFVNPKCLCWLNLAFNELHSIPDELLELHQLQILYFHANLLPGFDQVTKLKLIRSLRSLTLHGNPIEKERNYRANILGILPDLRSLDFSDVTSADLFVARAAAALRLRIRERRAARRHDD